MLLQTQQETNHTASYIESIFKNLADVIRSNPALKNFRLDSGCNPLLQITHDHFSCVAEALKSSTTLEIFELHGFAFDAEV